MIAVKNEAIAATAAAEPLKRLSDGGLSVWLDDLSRERITSGNLAELIEKKHVVGVTTNPSIFQAAIGFAYGESFTESSPEAYERLILDVLLGDANLFPRHQEVEESWRILDPIEEYWDRHGRPAQYPSGTWGPEEADEMLARDGRSWRRP